MSGVWITLKNMIDEKDGAWVKQLTHALILLSLSYFRILEYWLCEILTIFLCFTRLSKWLEILEVKSKSFAPTRSLNM